MKYILKTKGTDKIPDYLQIRDEQFQLIAHCTVKNSERILIENGIDIEKENILSFVKGIPFGKLTKVASS